MSTLFAAVCMNQASQSQGLGQGAGFFVAADFSASGSYAMDPAMPSPMLSTQTGPEKVPPNCRRI